MSEWYAPYHTSSIYNANFFRCCQGGAEGQTGATGTEGIIGPYGYEGSLGCTGISGLTGPFGLEGSLVTGMTGIDACLGCSGPTGSSGPLGMEGMGRLGCTGVTGHIGSTGTFCTPYAESLSLSTITGSTGTTQIPLTSLTYYTNDFTLANSQITVQTQGLYDVRLMSQFQSENATTSLIWFRKNTANVAYSTTASEYVNKKSTTFTNSFIPFASNDILDCQFSAVGGEPILVDGSNQVGPHFPASRLHISRISATYNTFAEGGSVSTYMSNGSVYRVHSFTSNGTLTLYGTANLSVNYLLVAGGGGGGPGNGGGGGGGGGGALTGTSSLAVTSYSIVVGNGGAAGTGVSNKGGNGANSTFNNLTAIGGGGGGSGNDFAGQNGGCGGGGSYYPGKQNGGIGSQGYNGGNGTGAPSNGGGGGGGMGAVGKSAATGNSYGGDGFISSITGVSLYYAGGGGGGRRSTDSAGGQGGGGKGGFSQSPFSGASGVAGTDGLGGGGGGACDGDIDGAKGGSGIVIISYIIS